MATISARWWFELGSRGRAARVVLAVAALGLGSTGLFAQVASTQIRPEDWPTWGRDPGNTKFSPLHVKVLTEAGVVYLMGMVSTEEGDAAVEIARTTSGVNRVVKVFEYQK